MQEDCLSKDASFTTAKGAATKIVYGPSSKTNTSTITTKGLPSKRVSRPSRGNLTITLITKGLPLTISTPVAFYFTRPYAT